MNQRFPIVLAQPGLPTEAGEIDLDAVLEEAPATPTEAMDVVLAKLVELWTALLESLPILILGLIIFTLALVAALWVARTVTRGIRHSSMDRSVAGLLSRLLRLALIVVAVMFALSVMGISVGSVLGLLAVAGLAVGLAVQHILENFIAGIILLIRKPIRAGDQIISGDFEGTVEDIDFRVTRLLTYAGTVVLIPNGDVYSSPLINLTTRGKRRTTVTVGVDYRDDHDRAREVLAEALREVEGVLEDPPSEVLLTELAESSVNFELRYWTAPDIRSVRHTQDSVLGAAKSAIEGAGMTIPWPIRTLVVDGDSDIQLRNGRRGTTRAPDHNL